MSPRFLTVRGPPAPAGRRHRRPLPHSHDADLFEPDNRQFIQSTGRPKADFVADFSRKQRPRQGREPAYRAVLRVRFVNTDDAVSLFFAVLMTNSDGRTESHFFRIRRGLSDDYGTQGLVKGTNRCIELAKIGVRRV